VYVHVDRKSPALQKSMEQKYSDNKRVNFLSDPVKVYWGGFSHLDAILRLLKSAYANEKNQRFHLISGQDHPIRSKTEFDRFFKTNAEKEFISFFKLPDTRWQNGGLDRVDYFHLNDILDPKKYFFPRINGRFVRLQKFFGMKRKQPATISSWYGGGTWWSISRKAVAEIFSFQKNHPGFLRRFKNTYCGEEIFFQTILAHSSLKENMVPEDLRYIDWSFDGKFPAVLDESYLEEMFRQQKFFARKFDSGISAELKKRLEAVVDGND
jgi:hypothetical protein